MGRVEGLVLAAGLSSRAGVNKLLLKIGDKTIIEKCIEGMYDSCSRIIVVGGYKIQDITPVLTQYGKVEIVFNADYQAGMFSSVKEGIRRSKEERLFITPGDYPFIAAAVYKTMLETAGDIIVPTYKEKKGHPVLINANLAGQMINEGRYRNLREFINTKNRTLVEVNEPGILLDVDTMDDYERMVKLAWWK